MFRPLSHSAVAGGLHPLSTSLSYGRLSPSICSPARRLPWPSAAGRRAQSNAAAAATDGDAPAAELTSAASDASPEPRPNTTEAPVQTANDGPAEPTQPLSDAAKRKRRKTRLLATRTEQKLSPNSNTISTIRAQFLATEAAIARVTEEAKAAKAKGPKAEESKLKKATVKSKKPKDEEVKVEESKVQGRAERLLSQTAEAAKVRRVAARRKQDTADSPESDELLEAAKAREHVAAPKPETAVLKTSSRAVLLHRKRRMEPRTHRLWVRKSTDRQMLQKQRTAAAAAEARAILGLVRTHPAAEAEVRARLVRTKSSVTLHRHLRDLPPHLQKRAALHDVRVQEEKTAEDETTAENEISSEDEMTAEDQMTAKLRQIIEDHVQEQKKKTMVGFLSNNLLSQEGREMVLEHLSRVRRSGRLIAKPKSPAVSAKQYVSDHILVAAPPIEVDQKLSDRWLLDEDQELSPSDENRQDGHQRGKDAPEKVAAKKRRSRLDSGNIASIDANDLHLSPIEKAQPPVPSLSYGLDRVLFNPGVYYLQDPRSRVFNFDPYLHKIMPVAEFDFKALKEYVTSSRDEALISLASALSKKYTGSTSSMTAALSHFHFLLSQWRPINPQALSRGFPVESTKFTVLSRSPAAIFLRWRDGVYAIDADKEYDSANILSMLGKAMEKLLTLPTDQFERYRHENSDQISEDERNEPEAFHYTTMGDFMMRSQLDAYDPRLPGTGMFDLKTRAVVSIRMDVGSPEKGNDYEIITSHGKWLSYEREYYDMMRAAFLKYSLQVRMGRMDGIFVAFHNTRRIFGFQYISLSEMDQALHGTPDTSLGDAEFKLSLDLLNKILNRATTKFPKKSIRMFFDTREATTNFMYIFAEPVEEKEVTEIQERAKEKIDRVEKRLLGVVEKSEEQLRKEKEQEEWDALQANVENELEADETAEDVKSGDDDVIADSKKQDKLAAASSEDDFMEFEDVEESERSLAANEKSTSRQSESTKISETVAKTSQPDDSSANSTLTPRNDLDLASNGTKPPEKKSRFSLRSLQELFTGRRLPEKDTDETSKTQPPAVSSSTKDKSDEATSQEEEEEASPEEASPEDLADAFLEGQGVNPTHSDSISITGSKAKPKKAAPKKSKKAAQEPPEPKKEVLAMTLTIRNKVNGEFVERPENLTKDDKWTVDYVLSELPDKDRDVAYNLYQKTKMRRMKAMSFDGQKWDSSEFFRELGRVVKESREWRKERDDMEKDLPVRVFGEDGVEIFEQKK